MILFNTAGGVVAAAIFIVIVALVINATFVVVAASVPVVKLVQMFSFAAVVTA